QGSATGTEPRHQCQRLETLCLGALDPCLSSSSIRSGVNGTLISATPSASATALAMQTGVLIALPSATPLAPSGVTGEGLSRCRISSSGIIEAVGTEADGGLPERVICRKTSLAIRYL